MEESKKSSEESKDPKIIVPILSFPAKVHFADENPTAVTNEENVTNEKTEVLNEKNEVSSVGRPRMVRRSSSAGRLRPEEMSRLSKSVGVSYRKIHAQSQKFNTRSDSNDLTLTTNDNGDSFVKTLESDIGSSQSIALLQEVQQLEPVVFSQFSLSDLKLLADYLSVLNFDADERVIKKGESASFCAIVLGGVFHAIISDNNFIPLAKGQLVGEMAFFEGGVRNADIICKEAGILAVISFEDLQKLKEMNPEFQSKITHMLAIGSIRKLRNMVKQQPTNQPIVGLPPQTPRTPHQSISSLSSIQSSTSTDSSKSDFYHSRNAKESLFLERIRKQAAHVTKLLENEKSARIRAQLNQRTTEHKTVNLSNKVKQLTEELRRTRAEKEELERNFNNLNRSYLRVNSDYFNSQEERKTLTEKLETQEKQFEEEKQKSLMEFNLQFQTLQVKTDEIRRESIELRSIRDSLESELQKKNETEILQKLQIAELQKEIQSKNKENEQLNSRNEDLTIKKLQLEREMGYLEFRLKESNTKLDESAIKIEDLKKQISDHFEVNRQHKSQLKLHSDNIRKEKNQYQRKLSAVAFVLRRKIIQDFVRRFKIKKKLLDLHQRVSEMLTARMEENREITGPVLSLHLKDNETNESETRNDNWYSTNLLSFEESAGNNRADNLTAIASAALNRSADNNNNNNNNSNNQTATAVAVSSFFMDSLKRDKRKQLRTLRDKKFLVTNLIHSLDEELLQLKVPLGEMHSHILELKRTLKSFFQRNVQLTAKSLNIKRALEIAQAQYELLRSNVLKTFKYEPEMIRRLLDTSTNNNTNNQTNNETKYILDPTTPSDITAPTESSLNHARKPIGSIHQRRTSSVGHASDANRTPFVNSLLPSSSSSTTGTSMDSSQKVLLASTLARPTLVQRQEKFIQERKSTNKQTTTTQPNSAAQTKFPSIHPLVADSSVSFSSVPTISSSYLASSGKSSDRIEDEKDSNVLDNDNFRSPILSSSFPADPNSSVFLLSKRVPSSSGRRNEESFSIVPSNRNSFKPGEIPIAMPKEFLIK